MPKLLTASITLVVSQSKIFLAQDSSLSLIIYQQSYTNTFDTKYKINK